MKLLLPVSESFPDAEIVCEQLQPLADETKPADGENPCDGEEEEEAHVKPEVRGGVMNVWTPH